MAGDNEQVRLAPRAAAMPGRHGDLFILVIDAGTTSTRAMLFAPGGECLGSEARPRGPISSPLCRSW